MCLCQSPDEAPKEKFGLGANLKDMPDKNCEIWAGGLQSGRFMRFSPKTEKWTQYMMPRPYAHDRRTWVDNSTNPVAVWYVDHDG